MAASSRLLTCRPFYSHRNNDKNYHFNDIFHLMFDTLDTIIYHCRNNDITYLQYLLSLRMIFDGLRTLHIRAYLQVEKNRAKLSGKPFPRCGAYLWGYMTSCTLDRYLLYLPPIICKTHGQVMTDGISSN